MNTPVSPRPVTSPDSTRAAWHAMTVDAVLAQLESAPAGLSTAEAARRLDIHGANELQATQRASPWLLLLEQFKNVLVIILLVATVLSAFMGHGIEAIAIAVIVLFAVLLGFVQEFRAERAIEALRRMAAPAATVLRDGIEISVPARDLVPGDVILLRAGDKVPADARLCESINLQIEEAALTGESLAVEKHTTVLTAAELPVGDRRNMAYAGTAVTYGRGRATVVATGMRTEFGSIAQMLQGVDSRKTPLQVNLDKLGHILARVAFAIVAAIVVIGLLRGQPFVDMLVFGIALAVAVVPEALPAVVTISLAIGVQRMVKRNALMRRLPAVETLGCTSVICSDKTGTLTKDEMTVRRLVAGDQTLDVSGSGYEPQGQFTCDGVPVQPGNPVRQLLQAAILASDAHLAHDTDEGRWRVKGDATEGAMVVAAAKAGLDKADLDARHPRLDEIPFTSETKRMTTLHRFPDGVVACAKGAPEIILAGCTRQLTAAGEVPLDTASRERVLAAARQMAGDALRVLAIATKAGATKATAEQDMTLLGLVGMIDPPRPEAKAAIQTCRQAGIKVVMITGDHPVTAQAVARELGLLHQGRVVTGPELEAMSDADFQRAVTEIEVYARVSPAHKLRVVTALQQQGAVVAMTGDGVNDAPALKKADIGIAMGITGTDVTKEAAAMTLTDDNFASIVAAVEEGRGIFDNIKKYLMYLLSSNIGEMGLMVAATLAGLPLPLSAVQILYVNLATDGLPALALAVDPPDRGIMQRRPRNPRTGIFSRPVVTLMLVGGLWSAVANMALFQWARTSGRSLAEAMTMTFVALVLIEFVKAYCFRSDRHSALARPFANKWLNLAIAWEVLLLLAVVYVPFLQKAIGTFSLTRTDWLIAVIPALTVIPVLELTKWLVRRGRFGGRESTTCSS
ncbi:MAG: ATPase [Lentisphaerae bacterium RIFOXYB12_FULL_65_16]|nr:MAG: ATPase [Lentisphaerae bacterium RIFOXYA12_64_32]OGV87170.1 MAG: ATPase [Lentisphaerae bacterium RIFOXYB12_FULL_65_16]